MITYETALGEIGRRAALPTDIGDHLVTLYHEALETKPQLSVELGVRGGESTFVLERVARLVGGKLVSVDLVDCSQVTFWPGWFFVQRDDLQFAKEFPEWCRDRGIKPQIEVLFIDTSHLYDHTAAEIAAWFPFLATRAKVIFHDTNLQEIYYRRNGQTGQGWDNQRGVIRAIEDYLGRSFNEQADFEAQVNGWHIKHDAICNGLTILARNAG